MVQLLEAAAEALVVNYLCMLLILTLNFHAVDAFIGDQRWLHIIWRLEDVRKNMLVGLSFGLGGLLHGAQLLLLFELQLHELLKVMRGDGGHVLLWDIAHLLHTVLYQHLSRAEFPHKFFMRVVKVKMMVRVLI